MKNGLFNLIRGIAFCFVLSIIFIFGRVDVKADSIPYSQITGEYIYQLCCEKVGADLTDITFNSNKIRNGMNKQTYYAPQMVTDDSYPYAILSDKFSDTLYQFYVVSMPKNPVSDEDVETFCNKYLYHQISQNFVYDSSNKKVYALGYADNGSIQAYSFTANKIAVANKDSSGVFRVSGTDSNSWGSVTFYSYQTDILYYSNQSSSPKYDSSIGYLDNCIRKCMNQLSYSDSNGGFHSIVDVTTDKLLGINSSLNFEGLDGVDCYSWLDKTTSGKSFDSVEVYIFLFKEGSLVKENSFILEGYPLYYDVSWKSLDSAISGLDLLTLKYNYQIWFRPLSANSYGDWVYFDCEYNRVSERIQSLVSHILDGDIINSIDDFKLTVENCQFGIAQGDYNKPSDVPLSSIVPNVLYNGVYTQIYKPTISDDDKDNILQQIPDSSTSYTDINNNITIIQNGGENGESLLDKMGDLLSFFTNFLTFIYKFINLLLSPLSFLPSWLKTLISTSIIAFIVICVIKTLRG